MSKMVCAREYVQRNVQEDRVYVQEKMSKRVCSVECPRRLMECPRDQVPGMFKEIRGMSKGVIP